MISQRIEEQQGETYWQWSMGEDRIAGWGDVVRGPRGHPAIRPCLRVPYFRPGGHRVSYAYFRRKGHGKKKKREEKELVSIC